MKSSRAVLALIILLALVPCTQSVAQPAGPAVAAVPADVADFLATLSDEPATVPGTGSLPAPRPLATYCASNADCPTGQLCCYPCGIDGCERICMKPLRGRCPLFV